jgi:hypothetical protein
MEINLGSSAVDRPDLKDLPPPSYVPEVYRDPACVQALLWICDDREPGPRLAEIRLKSGYPTGKTYINGTIGVPIEYIPAPSALIKVQRRDSANV